MKKHYYQETAYFPTPPRTDPAERAVSPFRHWAAVRSEFKTTDQRPGWCASTRVTGQRQTGSGLRADPVPTVCRPAVAVPKTRNPSEVDWTTRRPRDKVPTVHQMVSAPLTTRGSTAAGPKPRRPMAAEPDTRLPELEYGPSTVTDAPFCPQRPCVTPADPAMQPESFNDLERRRLMESIGLDPTSTMPEDNLIYRDVDAKTKLQQNGDAPLVPVGWNRTTGLSYRDPLSVFLQADDSDVSSSRSSAESDRGILVRMPPAVKDTDRKRTCTPASASVRRALSTLSTDESLSYTERMDRLTEIKLTNRALAVRISNVKSSIPRFKKP